MNSLAIWAGKLIIGLVLSGGVVWAVSFGVADYVVKANTNTLQSSIDNLNTNLNSFNSLITQQLAELRSEKEALAVSIAEKVGELRARDTEILAQAVAAAAGSAAPPPAIRVTFDGGKTFEALSPEEFAAKYGDTLQLSNSFAIMPGGFVNLP